MENFQKNKAIKYTYNGANQDITKSKHSQEFYFDAQHIRITATDSQSTGSVTNEKGNTLVVSLPRVQIEQSASRIIYGDKSLNINYTSGLELDNQINNNLLSTDESNHKLIGKAIGRNSFILFTNSNNMDCIWEVENVLEGEYNLKLLYVRNLNFSRNNPIQAIFNFENENIQKVYWVDGKNQIRFINIKNDQIEDVTPLIDLPSTSINFVGTVDFTQPVVNRILSGGNHTAGVIQYAYNLYRLNNSQTKLSPLSQLIPLTKPEGLGGGEVNELVGATPVVEINNIDNSYTNIKVYAIKYTSFNEIPSVNLIADREIPDDRNLIVYDDGINIDTLSLAEFLFLGSDPITPKHIETKENRLFPANIKSKNFILPEELDFRAYSFNINSDISKIGNNVQANQDGDLDINATSTLEVNSEFQVPKTFDAINLNYNQQRYKKNSDEIGGTGKFLEYTLDKVQFNSNNLNEIEKYKYFKDDEIYRIGIELYNRLGQTTLPYWISDFKAPISNWASGNFRTILKVKLKQEFYDFINNYNFESDDDKPVGYRILRADRKERDKTIITQGIISGMMVNNRLNSRNAPPSSINQRKEDSLNTVVYPSILMRNALFDNPIPLRKYEHMRYLQPFETSLGNIIGPTLVSITRNSNCEIWGQRGLRYVDAYQYNIMQQIYSPEVMFDQTINYSSNLIYKPIALLENFSNKAWHNELEISTQLALEEYKINDNNALLFSTLPNISNLNNVNIITGTKPTDILDRGLHANTNSPGDRTHTNLSLYYRRYARGNSVNFNSLDYNIYGAPEIQERGQGPRTYNNDSNFRYANTLVGVGSDGNGNNTTQAGAVSIESFNNRCTTLVLGGTNISYPHNRPTIEEIISNNFTIGQNTFSYAPNLVSEIRRPVSYIYFSNMYGGNTYEEKRRTEYLQIGKYTKINQDEVVIDKNVGDTFFQIFRFQRITPTETEVLQHDVNSIIEIVEYPVETTIDLNNRNDLSLFSWDSRFRPLYNEYHRYNRVYSQQSNLLRTTNVEATFRRINEFDARIQSTKLKIPNETIDSWTDILPNELLDLDGKYGPINHIVSFKDQIFAFQDEAISGIAVNPRIQIPTEDGIGLELGTGGILSDYKYITTSSGSINKWSILPTKKGIYYLDLLNKSIGRVPDGIDISLSDIKGFHSDFFRRLNYNSLSKDNPLQQSGAVFGYDSFNQDVFMTFLQKNGSYTRVFNELKDSFIDLKTYTPNMYFNKGNKLLVPFENKLYEQYSGNYNEFFGEIQDSFITLLVNPNVDQDTVFNNVYYNSEVYLNDLDQPLETLTHIKAWNEYQDSGVIPLEIGRDKNLRRKFREWKANIPREGRNRIRNPWIFLQLKFENNNNYKLILHDIIVTYNN